MKHCKNPHPCWEDGVCRFTAHCEHELVTNADRIRAMTDEELAEYIYKHFNHDYMPKQFLEWLKQPAEENDG